MRPTGLLPSRSAMLIGDFAPRARLPISTLRYYDRIGLLTPAAVQTRVYSTATTTDADGRLVAHHTLTYLRP